MDLVDPDAPAGPALACNVRELQNVIERAVIVAETDVLTVDEHWLARGRRSGRRVR